MYISTEPGTTSRDITERKKAEKALAESETKLKTLFEILPVGASVLNAQRKIVSVNPALERILDISKESLFKEDYRSRTYLRHDGTLMPAEEFASVRAIKEQRAVHNVETGVVKDDGTVIWTNVSAVPLGFPDWEVLVVTSDITERRRAEEALQATERRFRALIEKSSDVISLLAADGTILYESPAAVRILGYAAEELKGRNAFELVHPDDVQATTALFAQLTQMPGASTSTQFRFCHKDGSWRWLDLVGTNLLMEPSVQAMIINYRDITERKRAEEALRVSHRFLEIANQHMEMSPLLKEFVVEVQNFTGCAAVGLRMLDAEGNIPYEAYAGFSRRFYESESPLSIKSDQCMCINVIKRVTDPTHSFYTKGGSFCMNGTTRFLATVSEEEKGRTRNVCNLMGYESVALVPIHAEGRIIGLIHVADPRENMVPLEVVEVLEGAAMQLGTAIQRVRAEEALRESEERFRAIASNTPDYITTQDSDLRYKFVVNPQLGLAVEDMIGKTDRDFLEKEEAEHLIAIKRKVLETGEPVHLEVPLRNLKGETEFFDGSYIPKFDSTGKVDGLIGYFRNITERKLTEEELRESEERYRRLVEGSPEAIAVHSEGKFVFVNSAGAKLVGAKNPQELIGTPVLDIVHPNSRSKVVDRMRDVAKGKEAPLFEEKFVKFDGSVIDVEVVGIPYPYRGQIATQVVVRDITERKRAQERLKATQEQLHRLAGHLQSVREEERKLLSQEFHDQLGQSLTALKMDLSMLHRSVTDPGKELSRTIIALGIESMHGMIDRAIGIIREIMSELRPELLDQLGIVPTLEWEAERFQRHSGISCTFNSKVGELALGEKKSIALYRIFQEAVTNVARHSKATSVEVSLRKEGTFLVLEIKDNGVGISADAEHKACSFGLIGMRERAILLGGTLEICGVDGKGTTILVRIPFEQTFADGGAAL